MDGAVGLKKKKAKIIFHAMNGWMELLNRI